MNNSFYNKNLSGLNNIDANNITFDETINNIDIDTFSFIENLTSDCQAQLDDKIENIQIGTVNTTNSGGDANVTSSKIGDTVTLNFQLPRGDKGDKGETGSKGDKGDTGDSTLAAQIAAAASAASAATAAGAAGAAAGSATSAAASATSAAVSAGSITSQNTILQEQIDVLDNKTQYQTTILDKTRFTSNLSVSNGVSDLITLNNSTGNVSCDSVSSNGQIEGGSLVSNSTGYYAGDVQIHGNLYVNGIYTISPLGTLSIGRASQSDTTILNGTVSQPLNDFFNSFQVQNGFLNQI